MAGAERRRSGNVETGDARDSAGSARSPWRLDRCRSTSWAGRLKPKADPPPRPHPTSRAALPGELAGTGDSGVQRHAELVLTSIGRCLASRRVAVVEQRHAALVAPAAGELVEDAPQERLHGRPQRRDRTQKRANSRSYRPHALPCPDAPCSHGADDTPPSQNVCAVAASRADAPSGALTSLVHVRAGGTCAAPQGR